MQIITRAEAKAAALKRYFTGKPCKHGHIAERVTSSGVCRECLLIRERAWRETNPEIAKARLNSFRDSKGEQTKEYRQEYYRKNSESRRQESKDWRKRNPDRAAENKRAWICANPERHKAIMSVHRAIRRQRESLEADDPEKIAAWLKASPKVCYWCSTKCKTKYHVDHYKPLCKGGRHEVSNLVIACPTCNLRKNAKDPFEFAASVGRLF